jgi:branched-chain amino acid aminotransferase
MELLQSFVVRKTTNSRIDTTDFDNLGFGSHVSDHMLIADFSNGQWDDVQIVPFSNLSISPATLALHYGQTVFEGMKAFQMQDGKISIFRVNKHFDRFVQSLERMCMAVVPNDIFKEGLKQLIGVDRKWVPPGKGASLYIRPFMYASEAKFGVKPSDEYRFVVFTGPVGPVFPKPLKVKVETEYVRAVKGGTGYAKCGGNYGGSLYPTRLAQNAGYDQVLWTDGKENKYVEESGMMNVMFVIENTLVTPPLSDSILDGVTRDSLLVLAKDMGIPVEERPVSVDELHYAFKSKSITEAFGAGTAAVVAPIQTIHLYGIDHFLPMISERNVMNRLKKKLDGIRTGTVEDVYGWNSII